MVVAGITLIGTLLTLLVGTLLYSIKRTDTRQEKHSKEHRQLMRESDAEHRKRMQEIDAEHRQLIKESDAKFEARMRESDTKFEARMHKFEAHMRASDTKFEARMDKFEAHMRASDAEHRQRMQEMRTENKKLLSDAGKLIAANAEGIAKLQVLVEANRKDVEANIEGMKDFRRTAAFQNQLLIKNNRSLGRIEGILGVQQIDETEEPPLPIYDVEADLEEDAEELEGIKERAEMTPDR